MKASKHQCLIGVAAVLLYSTVSSIAAQEVDYLATDLDDPLQPVWATLDRLPVDVSDAVIRDIRTQFTRLNTQLENKVRPLTNAMTSVTSSLRRLEQIVSGGDTTQGTSSNSAPLYETRVLNDIEEAVTKLERHINTKMTELENKLKLHIDSKFLPAANAGGEGSQEENAQPTGIEGQGVIQTLRANTMVLENINTHVLKINEKLGGSSEGDATCSTLVDKVSELLDGSAVQGGMCTSGNQETFMSRLGLPRDCSDKHWQLPEAPSGVYEIFPTLDPKAPSNAYCDMGQPGAKDTGGWTVILRRRNSTYGLVNFNRTWNEYRTGFGDPAEGEWWFGLAPLHALTYRQPFEVDLLLHDIELGFYNAQYSTFRLEDEAQNFKLILSGFNGNLTHDALILKHHGSSFTTWDKDNDLWEGGNCGQSNGGGWWFNACHYTTLTAPFPTSTNRNAKTIRWLEDDWLVLDDVTMKIRPANYAERFNAHSLP